MPSTPVVAPPVQQHDNDRAVTSTFCSGAFATLRMVPLIVALAAGVDVGVTVELGEGAAVGVAVLVGVGVAVGVAVGLGMPPSGASDGEGKPRANDVVGPPGMAQTPTTTRIAMQIHRRERMTRSQLMKLSRRVACELPYAARRRV